MQISKYDIKLATLDAEEKEFLFEEIINDLEDGKSPSADGKKIKFVLGLPGTGKTTYSNQITKEDDNYVKVTKDDMYRYHPFIHELHRRHPVKLNSKDPNLYDIKGPDNEEILYSFAEEMNTTSLATLITKGYNVIIDDLPSENMILIASIAKSQGYDVEFNILSAPKQHIETNIIQRYEEGIEKFRQAEMGLIPQDRDVMVHPYTRMRLDSIDRENISSAINMIEQGGYKLSVISGSTKKKLYSSENPTNKGAEKAFFDELDRPLSEKEQKILDIRRRSIEEKMKKRDASKYDRVVLNNTARNKTANYFPQMTR